MNKNEQLVTAIELAVRAHGSQLDKAGLPYILHPLHVMDQVDEIDAKTVAVLHDVIEDTEWKISRLYDEGDNVGKLFIFSDNSTDYYEFPEHILVALDAITKRKSEKKEVYWARVKANPLALQVKLADIAHNSSEARLACLPKEDAEYLRGKYKKAIAFFYENYGLISMVIDMKFGDAVYYLEKVNCFSPWNYIMNAVEDEKIIIDFDNIIKWI